MQGILLVLLIVVLAVIVVVVVFGLSAVANGSHASLISDHEFAIPVVWNAVSERCLYNRSFLDVLPPPGPRDYSVRVEASALWLTDSWTWH